MPILFYRRYEDHLTSHTFLDKLQIGSDSENDLVLPAESGIKPFHATIIRSALNRQHILVNQAGCATLVNGQQVVSIKVLHQQDEILLGNLSFRLWEMCIISLPPEHPLVGKKCLICTEKIEAGEELIVCPRCSTPHHRNCGFSISVCANYTCEYPIRKSILNALTSRMKIEDDLTADSELVEVIKDGRYIKRGVKCSAGIKGDEVAFQVNNSDPVAFCPFCNHSFHLTCWLLLVRCPICNFEARTFIDEIFLVEHAGFVESNVHQMGAVHVI